MLQILKDLESAIGGTVGLSPVVLVGPGLAIVLMGLFIWLGGLGFKKLLLPAAGAITGAVCGFFIIEKKFISVAFSAAVAAAFATILDRVFIAILTAALAAAFAFVVLAGPHIENSQQANTIMPAQGTALSASESAEKMKDYIIDASQRIKHAGLQTQMYHWAIIMVLALIFMVAGFFLGRLAMALCCSILGTILIFAGMILLLLHKGALPVSIICSKSSYYAAAFIAMTAFGTIEQLLLCKPPKTQSAGKKQKSKNKQEPERIKGSWRTS